MTTQDIIYLRTAKLFEAANFIYQHNKKHSESAIASAYFYRFIRSALCFFALVRYNIH